MNITPPARIVRVTSLKNFIVEVPVPPGTGAARPVVRLLNRQTEVQMSATLLLSLQGVNRLDEIVWLCEARTISWINGQPFGQAAESAYRAMRDLTVIVQGFLESQGYDVRSGDYGLPDNIKPLSADFECARWVKTGDYEWQVQAVDLAQAVRPA